MSFLKAIEGVVSVTSMQALTVLRGEGEPVCARSTTKVYCGTRWPSGPEPRAESAIARSKLNTSQSTDKLTFLGHAHTRERERGGVKISRNKMGFSILRVEKRV